MPDSLPSGSSEILGPTEKDAALALLREYRSWTERRDPLVCAAKRADASYSEIINAGGLARGTVNTILARAGLTGPLAPAPEEPVPTTTRPRYFPHHPHFMSATKHGSSHAEYQFRAFTGDEPEPVYPEMPGPYKAAAEQSDKDKAMWAEYTERVREIDTATLLWKEARYLKQITPLVDAACKARPAVDAALREMDEAWAALDNAPVWQVAVKRVLDAHDAAQVAMRRWVDEYAEPLAMVEGSLSVRVLEHVKPWQDIARQLGHDRPEWEIGWYYKGDRHGGASYDRAPMTELDRTITEQRAKLKEIAEFSKQGS
jgi:hypothetical protein